MHLFTNNHVNRDYGTTNLKWFELSIRGRSHVIKFDKKIKSLVNHQCNLIKELPIWGNNCCLPANVWGFFICFCNTVITFSCCYWVAMNNAYKKYHIKWTIIGILYKSALLKKYDWMQFAVDSINIYQCCLKWALSN